MARRLGLLGLGVALGCSRPAPPAEAKQDAEPGAKANASSEASASPPKAASEVLPKVKEDRNTKEQLEKAAAAVPKKGSPITSEVPTPPDVAAPPKSATKTKSGLAYVVLTKGEGASPGPEQSVKVHYSGWTPKGRLFDSSVSRHSPITFPLAKASEGWREALSAMKVGERRRVWMSEAQARQDGLTLPPGPLVYELELLEIVG